MFNTYGLRLDSKCTSAAQAGSGKLWHTNGHYGHVVSGINLSSTIEMWAYALPAVGSCVGLIRVKTQAHVPTKYTDWWQSVTFQEYGKMIKLQIPHIHIRLTFNH